MADTVHVARGSIEEGPTSYWAARSPTPCWMIIEIDGRTAKPIIKCNCGELVSLASGHHVYADGHVTNSFYHREPEGCGWHVYLILDDWTGEDLPPGTE